MILLMHRLPITLKGSCYGNYIYQIIVCQRLVQFILCSVCLSKTWVTNILLEQMINIKFSVTLEKSTTDNYKMLQQVVEIEQWIEHWFLCRLRDIRRLKGRCYRRKKYWLSNNIKDRSKNVTEVVINNSWQTVWNKA